MKNNRVELCCHTKMSELQGLNTIEEYINEAILRGDKAIAITDTSSTQAFFEAYEDNQIEDFKVIYGAELNFKESKRSSELYTIYIYVKEQRGLKNLYKIISNSYNNRMNGKAFVYRKELNQYREGLLYAAIGNKSEVYHNIHQSNIRDIIQYYDFVGIEPDGNKNTNRKIVEQSNALNQLIIATSNCNFISKEDYKYNEILNFYKNSANLKEGNSKYFYTTEELINSFDYIENVEDIVINNTKKIADHIENIRLVPNKGHYPIIKNSKKRIKEICDKRVYELYGDKLPKEVKDRLDLELDSIMKNNFEGIYLIYKDLVKKSHELGYEVGCRGAVGNSFVAYLLEITNFNPIDYNLPFEIFAGKDYDKEPDIDLNFSREIQHNLFKYLQEKYGSRKVIGAGTIGSLTNTIVIECYKEYKKTFGIGDNSKEYEQDKILNKLVGIKRATGEHPGGVFIIPDEFEIEDFCATEIGRKGQIKTHIDYHSIWNHSKLYKFDILEHDDLTILHQLEKLTNTNSKNIDLDDEETLALFLHTNNKKYSNSINGIPEFGTEFVKEMIDIVQPKNFNDLVCICALSHGSNTWNYNAHLLIKKEEKKVDETISNRADMFQYFIKNGIAKDLAYDIVKFVYMGKASKSRSLRLNIEEGNNKWAEYKKVMEQYNIPKWYIDSAEKISYMFPKAHAISYTINAFKIAWYKVHYPEAFYKVYFRIKSELNRKEYYCKRQIHTELNRLYDRKQISNGNKDYDIKNNDKIKDLELLLEMYNQGILKEKKEIKDDYNLINSRAISDYCRSIKHSFNTEELAVLVYRNNKMSIDEKIEKYKDLMANYPDMEVIKRINCKHYNSVKTMIKNEINRLEKLYKEFIQEEDAIYTWNEKYGNYTAKTYKEICKDIESYIKEYNDTTSYVITKKYFDKRKKNIFANFNVENKKSKLVNITKIDKEFLDIDGIFLNIPTPFKKGDILISNSNVKNIGDCGDIFVLEYLCTWRDKLKEYLSRGNYDSSDMIAYAYYLYGYGENSTEFIRDDKWDYDSFEYYDDELTGNNRILKDISSFIKGKIELNLFVHAYDYYKAESKKQRLELYTDEGLKLAGMTDLDIYHVNHHDKIEHIG